MERRRTTWQRMVVSLAALLLTLAASRVAGADTLTVMWDATGDPVVAGYVVYIGTQPGTYSQNVNVGLTTQYAFSSAVPGQLYCFAVAAYVTGPIEGPKSEEVCGYSDERPTLSNPGAQTSTAGQADSLQLVGSDPEGLPVTYSAVGLPAGLTIGSSTGFISGTPTTGGTYSVTVTVSDGVLTASQTFSWSVAAGDTTAPTITITSPTSSSTYSTSTGALNLGGTAADAVGVTQVSWSNDRGGSGAASGTTAWSVNGITLQSGANVLTVTARDAANNTRTDSLTVTYTPPDTAPPAISIAVPTSSATYTTTTSPLTVSGIASDVVGVTQVSWANNRGGSGNATGTTTWSASGVALASGSNVLTITARDAAGNTSTDTLTVTYNPPDTTAPTAAISSPTSSATYTTSSGTLGVSGTASDAVGVSQVNWSNNRGGSGTATGTTSWSVAGITLASGSNVISVTARDAAGNTGTATLTVTYNAPDTTAPTVTITGPTSAATLATSATPVTVSGTASDNVGVTQVAWANDRGGSGTATGTTTWSASVALQSGANVITITSRDAAGNTATDSITVTYTAPDSTSPSIAIATPTTSTTHTTTTATISLGGTASDNVGVTEVTWSNNRGGNGTATGTTSWSVNGITLQSGANTLTVTVRDAAGNSSSDLLTVTYNEPDATAPTVTIAQPTSAATFSASTSTVNLSGTASDAVGVTQVTWSNDRGGSGTATGTTTWSVSGIALLSGANVVTITARDAAGNTATDTLTITMTAPLTLNSLTANKTAPQETGTAITFTATASNGTAPYQYKWWLFDGVSWTMLQNWSTGNTFTWTPTRANSGYRMAVWVRNAGSTADTYDNAASNASIPFPVTAVEPVVLTSLTANKTAPQPPSTAVTFTATATGGSTPHQYKWMLFNGTSTTVLQAWSASNTLTWTPSSVNPTYQITVWARSATSTADAADNANAARSMPFAVTALPLTLTAFTANVAAPQAAGTPITLTASATGGTAPYQYKWWLFDGKSWQLLQAWSASSSITWTPTEPSDKYRLGVWARNAGSTADAYDNPAANASIPFPISKAGPEQTAPLALTSLTANRPSPLAVGAPVTFTATVSGGTAPQGYKWMLSNGTTTSVVQSWSANSTWTWTPSVAGTYQLTVWARDASSSADAAQDGNSVRTISFSVTGDQQVPLTLTGLTPSLPAPQRAGTPITFTAAVSGGTGPHQYKWWVFDGNTWNVTQQWSTSNMWTWTPTSSGGNLRVAVWVRNAGSTADAYDNAAANASIPYAVTGGGSQTPSTGGLTLTALTSDVVSPQPRNTAITFTASATGGTAPYQYKWWLFDGKTWLVLADWSANASYTWTPSVADLNYRVGVWVRGAGSTADAYDNGANASIPFVITPTVSGSVLLLTGINSNLVSPQPRNTSITFSANALGGSGSYQYKWWIFDGTSWTVKQAWSSSNTFTWTPKTPGANYRVAVWIRNATSTTDAYDNPASNGSIGFVID